MNINFSPQKTKKQKTKKNKQKKQKQNCWLSSEKQIWLRNTNERQFINLDFLDKNKQTKRTT